MQTDKQIYRHTHTNTQRVSVIKFKRKSLGSYRKGKKNRKEEGEEEIRFAQRSLLSSRLRKVLVGVGGDIKVLCQAAQGKVSYCCLGVLPHLPRFTPQPQPV